MIQISCMELKHVKGVAALEKSCFSMPWSEAAIASELENPLALWLVAVVDGCVAGYIGSQSVLGEADMMNIAVDERFRRKGIARALVSALVRELSNRDVYSLTLEVRSSNEPAKALYNALGFAEVGCRRNYYSAPKEDALILRKEWQL